MSRLDEGKDVYENIKIPEELKDVVQKAIASHPREEIDRIQQSKKVKRFPAVRSMGYVAAAAVVCFTVALNTNEVFAQGMGDVPFIGGLARVLTVRSYERHEENKNISVNIPAVEMDSGPVMELQETDESARTAIQDDFQMLQSREFTGDINAEIEKLMNDYVADAEKRFEEYKQAFFETGGTEAEWNNREIDITTDYEVKYQQGSILSLVLSVDEAWCAAYGERYYYNLDLESNKKLTLKDVLGDDYQKTADAIITQEMEKRMAEDENYIYWGYTDDDIDIEGFKGVNEDTAFYINEAGNPVVCFGKYEIAPGFMGIQEFEIQK